jgi:5-methylcytosine-specific restriction endonuclease McrA
VYTLSPELAIDLITDNCYYCGIEPNLLNGIDRVDNSKGYKEDNVVTACKPCNIAKGARTKENFEQWILRAAKHLTQQGVM